jgi:uncharacterized protein (PEP-CTERM system associated)
MSNRNPRRTARAPPWWPAMLPLLLAAPAGRAELRTEASVDTRATYSDNIALAPPTQAQAGWVGELTPGLAFSDHSTRMQFDAGYQARLYSYSRQVPGADRRAESEFRGALHAEAISELLYLDAGGAYLQKPVSAFGAPFNSSSDSGYLSANRAHVKSYRLSPYIRRAFSPALSGELHYTYDSVNSDQPGFSRSTGNSVQALLKGGYAKLGWGLNASSQRLDSGVTPASTATSYQINARYALLPAWSLTAAAGHERYTYEQQSGELPSGKSWSLGMVWTLSSRTSVSASLGKRYFGNSNAFDAVHRSRATVWTASYSTDVTTAREQFLLPAALSTALLLDRLFAPNVADPALRQQAVTAFIKANGLPPTLVDSINYFSNRYVLQKQLQLSSVWNLPRSVLVLSLFDNRRQALSALRSDSTLLGSVNALYSDNIRQQGGGVTLNLRLRPHTALNLSANALRAKALDGSPNSHGGSSRIFTTSLTHQLGPQFRADLELRHQQGGVAGASGNYRENAVVAHISQRF